MTADQAKCLEDLKPYIDEVGLVQDRPGNHSGNPLLYTAEVCIVLKRKGWLTPELRDQFLRGVRSCQIEPGYYRRHPNFFQGDQERQDDYLALASLSVTLGAPEIAQEILAYGRAHRKPIPTFLGKWISLPYYFPNEQGWDAPFYARAEIGFYPTCIAALQWAAGENPGWMKAIWFTTSILSGPNEHDPSDRDSFILPWVALSVHGDANLKGEHLSVVRKFYPGGMPLLFASYFGTSEKPNWDHWLAVYSAGAEV